MSRTALIVVDVQRDFCEGGALAAAETLSLLEPLRRNIDAARKKGALIIFTRDWHPQNHSSFQANGGPWPVHCVANSQGAQLMPPIRPEAEDMVVNKGVAAEGPGYSGFEDTGLAERLKQLDVNRVGISGIATEYCVRATALDSVRGGFATSILSDLIRAVNPNETRKILAELKQDKAQITTAADWISSL
jgi:nicotinamidase/pyrazinamidase